MRGGGERPPPTLAYYFILRRFLGRAFFPLLWKHTVRRVREDTRLLTPM
jgi:hypothetical protein